MRNDFARGLFGALDTAVFRENESGRFEPLEPPPAWCRDFLPGSSPDGAVALDAAFAFLDTFLIEAREWWDDPQPGKLVSEPWSEADPHGVQRQMQATALFHGGERVLLIERLGPELERTREVLQLARETALSYQRLGRLAEAFQAAERRTREAIGAAPDTMLRVRLDGTYTDLSDATADAPARSLTDLLPEATSARFVEQARQVVEQAQPVVFDYSNSEGGVREARLVPLGADEALAVVRDVTRLRADEAELQRRIERLRSTRDDLLLVLDELHSAVAVIDETGRCSFVSEQARGMCPAQVEQCIGRPWIELPFLSGRRGAIERMLTLPPDRRRRVPFEFDRDGRRINLEIDIRDDPRDRRRKIVFLYDVTEVQSLRERLGEQGRFGRIVGSSRPMRELYDLIEDLAPVDATVLIEGETGVGKELVARELHARGRRSKGPFVAVNCAGLTETLAAGLLFGHRRGAFTGAITDQVGFFEAAHGGVLFLDEIGDVPAAVQTAFLRSLQEGEVTRLGETRPRRIDVRVVAATNRDLDEEVRQGRFRADLYYRLRVARVAVPPLRERLGDLPGLVERFLAEFRDTTGKPVRDVSAEALRLLGGYDWPGNVRELRSAIEMAVIRCRGPEVEPEYLPPEVVRAGKRASFAPVGDEADRYRRALRDAGGNRTQAAKLIGVSRATFYRKLTELGVDPEAG